MLLGVVGCGRADPQATSLGSADIPAPHIPSATARTKDAEPAWVKSLPPVAPTAVAGDRVWAVVPSVGPVARVGVFTVEGVFGDRYSLSDRKGARVANVRPAAVHPVGPRPATTTGKLVLCHTPTIPAVLARLGEVRPGERLRVQYDWAGKTKTAEVDHFETPREGFEPLAFVAFPHGGGRSRGLLVALDRRFGWVLTDAGHVEQHPRAELESLPLPDATLKKGAPVVAYRWASGFQKGKVVDVLESGLRYKVQPEGDRPPLEVFFDAVLPPEGWETGVAAPAPSTPPAPPPPLPRTPAPAAPSPAAPPATPAPTATASLKPPSPPAEDAAPSPPKPAPPKTAPPPAPPKAPPAP